jgi:hypothetical protein
MINNHIDPSMENTRDERRSGIDRRVPASFWALLSSQQRRRKSRGRRAADKGAYVDVYDSRTLCIVAAVLLLSLMDAVLTAMHMRQGSAEELNPIMNAVLAHGGMPAFFTVKAAMTVFPMAIITIHKEWAIGRFAARVCLITYVLLSLYHLYLLHAVGKLQGFLFARAL